MLCLSDGQCKGMMQTTFYILYDCQISGKHHVKPVSCECCRSLEDVVHFNLASMFIQCSSANGVLAVSWVLVSCQWRMNMRSCLHTAVNSMQCAQLGFYVECYMLCLIILCFVLCVNWPGTTFLLCNNFIISIVT